MIDLTTIEKIYLYPGTTDMRRGINGLLQLVEKIENNSLYVFCGKTLKTIKILHIEATGYWLYQRKNHKRKFIYPSYGNISDISKDELKWLIQGVNVIDRIEGKDKFKKYDIF